MRKSLALLTFSVFLFSCTVTENLTLNKNDFSSSADIFIEDFFLAVLEDYQVLTNQDGSIAEESLSSFVSSLSSYNAEYEKKDKNNYILNFSYKSISSMLSSLNIENQSLVKEGENSLSFYLDINNYEELKKIIPLLSDVNFEVYGPEYNIGMSEGDYLEMISFLLGDEGPVAVQSGTITINISLPGKITKAEGVIITSSYGVSFSFPLISFLLLDKPLYFSVEWE